jgi:hypothetical protein
MNYLKQIKSAISDIRNYPLLSKGQKKFLFKRCPHCEWGYLHAVPDNNDIETYLWCNNCDLSMDSDCGYIA